MTKENTNKQNFLTYLLPLSNTGYLLLHYLAFQMAQPHLSGDKQVSISKAGNSFLSFSGTFSIWLLMLALSPTCFLVSGSSLVIHSLHRNSRSRFQLLTSNLHSPHSSAFLDAKKALPLNHTPDHTAIILMVHRVPQLVAL